MFRKNVVPLHCHKGGTTYNKNTTIQHTMNTIRKITAYLLFPLSIVYTIVVMVRNKAFDRGVLCQRRHKTATIGVGNLSAGGTGKTPHIEYLTNMLCAIEGYKPAVLSRGYRRQTRGFVLATPTTTVEEIGDEPFQMYAKHPDVPVAVCEDRNLGMDMIANRCSSVNLVLLDDVYQHRYIRPDILVLLTDYTHPFYTDSVIPFGNLREPRSGYKRANIVVVTKCPTTLSTEEQSQITARIKPTPDQKIFFSYMEYGIPTAMDGQSTASLDSITDVLLLTGIANPKPLVNKVAQTCRIHLCRFADHHNFSIADIELIAKRFHNIKAKRKIILTTEKDYVRLSSTKLRPALEGMPIYYIPIQIHFHKSVDTSFDNEILRLLAKQSL